MGRIGAPEPHQLTTHNSKLPALPHSQFSIHNSQFSIPNLPPMTDVAELRRTLALAGPFKEGDLAVGGTRDERVRADAREAVAALRLGDLADAVLVDDGVTEALARGRDAALAAEVASLTVGEMKRILLGPTGPRWAARYRDGLSSEAIAAAVKTMSDDELSAVARRIFNPLAAGGAAEGEVTLGSPLHFGSRIQPNSPGDSEDEVLFSVLEGLTYGCGDVILGINPASDDLDTICRLESLLREVVERLQLPTRYCVLSDIVKQDAARARTRVDVGFQSLAGTSRGLRGMVGLDVEGLLELARGFDGLYFETGQGAEVTNGAAEGVDMVTLESRTYGVARYLQRHVGSGAPRWTIVNDVAGFIGPEVFRTGEQLVRACLEDSVMAKLHGLTMGLDVCSTFHMGIDPDALEALTAEIVERAAPAYLMAVAGKADPMLGYLTTSFREHPKLRLRCGRQPTSAMQRRLRDLGAVDADGQAGGAAERVAALYAAFRRAGGDPRPEHDVRGEGRRTLAELRRRGFDLGGGQGDSAAAQERVRRLFAHARRALYAPLDDAVLREVAPLALAVRTRAADRDQFLADPSAGERIHDADAASVAGLYPARRPAVQLVVSDGLNAEAANHNLRALLPPMRHGLAAAGVDVGDAVIVVSNGRVRAGYHVGQLLEAEAVIHLIGERPGTGLDTLSAYLTYGRDAHGRLRWSPELDHSCTTAVCGIHPRGRPPRTAADEIVRNVARMLESGRSGVALSNAERGMRNAE
jgi:ethanolamine ammonia-lyase large subunit